MNKTENLSAGEAVDLMISGKRLYDKSGDPWSYSSRRFSNIEQLSYAAPFHLECEIKDPELPEWIATTAEKIRLKSVSNHDAVIEILRAVDERIAKAIEEHEEKPPYWKGDEWGKREA